MPWRREEEDAFDSALLTIGLPARRGIPEARRIVNRFCHEEYWKGTEQPWFKGHPLGQHGMVRVKALMGRVFADWSVDEQLLKRLISENEGFTGYAESELMIDVLCRMNKEETKAITQREREEVQSYYSRYFRKYAATANAH